MVRPRFSTLLLIVLGLLATAGGGASAATGPGGVPGDSSDTENEGRSVFERMDIPQEEWMYVADAAHRGHPFANSALYRTGAPVRYNRVEGLVLGVGLRPLGWNDGERRRIYGQLGYALGLDRMRFRLGAESKLGLPFADSADLGLKLGVAWHRDTDSPDRWKTPTGENSFSALLWRRDRMDYYESEGWTAYAVKRLGRDPIAQLSVGYRSDEYRSLDPTTDWSVFRWHAFRSNPPIEEGRMHSLVGALELGRIRDFEDWPEGRALRIEAETSRGLGGDFSFARLRADGRTYLPLGANVGMSLRLRGGWSSEDAPLQKRYTLGGVGSVRGYPQNSFEGRRYALANLEFALRDVYLFFDDLQLAGLVDAGWISESRAPDYRDGEMLSVGAGLSYRDRFARLEIAWPLANAPAGDPAVWIRFNPTF